MVMRRPLQLGLLLFAGLLPACGPDEAPEVEVPSWAKVAPEQIAEAKKHGVPVAFKNDLGMRFVLIPAGTFLMGSPEDEEGRPSERNQRRLPFFDETQHEARISQPFYLQVTEVTNAGYRQVHPDHDSRDVRGESLNGDDCPVVWVTWKEARSFAEQVSRRDGTRTYRLPTEVEWEYACRSRTATPYAFGDTLSPSQASFDRYRSFDPGLASENHPRALPVGTFAPNRWGVLDMHGSVWEWCDCRCSWYDPAKQVEAEAAPRHMVDGTYLKASPRRIVRGGSRGGPARLARSAARYGLPEEVERWDTGFRLVSPLPEPGE